MTELGFLENFIHKQVDFKFAGERLQFYLSQSLFSSFDIDDGTRLLLKSIANQVKLDEVDTMLDIGCGVGAIGLCLKKANPRIQAVFQDRNALALAFTRLNAQLNQLDPVTVQSSLALDESEGERFDLIVSNLPGKAGPAALQAILGRIPGHLSENGVAAVVIVTPLAQLVEETLVENGSEILLKEDGKGYAIFHFRHGESAHEPESALAPYLRGSFPFKFGKSTVDLTTAFNVPEFDTLGFHTNLAINLVKNKQIHGRVLFWNPGQGHFPLYAARKFGRTITHYTVASRDLLSTIVSQLNLTAHGIPQEKVRSAHLPHLLEVEGTFDFIVLFPDMDPGVPWEQAILEGCHRLLAPKGRLLVTAKSAFMFRLLQRHRGFGMGTDKKRHGYRSAILKKAG